MLLFARSWAQTQTYNFHLVCQYAYTSALEILRPENPHELKASLAYLVSVRSTRATVRFFSINLILPKYYAAEYGQNLVPSTY